MRRSNISLADAVASLLTIRTALVRSAGLDEETEPIPLLRLDGRASVLTLARYLIDLLIRAADANDTTTEAIADHAIDVLPDAPLVGRQRRRLVALAEGRGF
jgi:hypothetical protein